MANENEESAIEHENENSQLDLDLWRKLPQDILEKAVLRLPFYSLVAFRCVCKRWYSVVIPLAAASAHEINFSLPNRASNRSALLYFGCHEYDYKFNSKYDSKGTPWWIQVCTAKSAWNGDTEEFQPTSFPSPRRGENVRLVASEGGLLFFAFVSKRNEMIRDIVVCNPLTGQSRNLGLPGASLRPGGSRCGNPVLVGVVFDATLATYHLVAAGVDANNQYRTFLYNSSTCTWTNATSMLPTFIEDGKDVTRLYFETRRSICCDGKLYWNAFLHNVVFVLKYDLGKDSWKIIPVDLDFFDCPKVLRPFVIAAQRDQVLIWHVHEHPLYANNIGFRGSSRENDIDTGYPYCQVGTSRSHLERCPELKVMPPHMIDGMEEFVDRCNLGPGGVFRNRGEVCFDYFGFSQGDFFYHVMRITSPDPETNGHPDPCEGFLRIVVHDTKVDAYTELPIVDEERFSEAHFMCPSNVWSFSASLIARP